ncbi:caprin-2 domain protein [Caudoviricetes sp.]|nr:caprin-2 domain protein [Caudoviricetes sp.]
MERIGLKGVETMFNKILIAIVFIITCLNAFSDGNTSRKLYGVTNTSGSGVFTFPTTTPTASRACEFDGSGVLQSSSTIDTTELGYLNSVSSALCGINQSCSLANKTLTLPQINDTSLDHQYVFAASELAADRTVTLPLLTGDDEFVFKNFTQTFTNKSIDADTNTLTNIENADIKAAAAIAVNKLAAVTASRALVSDGSGFVSPATTTSTQIGYLSAATGTTGTTSTNLVFSTSPALTTPDINGGTASNTSRIVLPSETTTNLDGLTDTAGLLAYDTTQSKPVFNNGSAWTAIGAGGSSGINYFSSNPDAESNTSGWVEYTDASAAIPENGTGGVSSGYWTRSTSSPLRGSGSFIYSHPGSDTRGKGVSFDFTIDAADKGKIQQISFDYAISTATFASTSTASDMIVYIYDVGNSVLIEPAGIYIQNATTDLPQKHIATFQAASNSTTYRLILHSATVTPTSYVIKLDNFSVGPQSGTSGTVITDMKAYTPTGAWTTNTTWTGFQRREGDSLLVHAQAAMGGAPNSAAFTVDLPAGLTIDTAKLPEAVASYNAAIDGGGTFSDADGSPYPLVARYISSTSVGFFLADDAASGTIYNTFNQATPVTVANSDRVIAFFRVPIVGWGSTTQMSDSTDTRVVALHYTNNGGTVITGDTTNIDWTTKVQDTHSAWSGTVFTAPVAGFYVVEGAIQYTTNTAGNVGIVVNGSSTYRAGFRYATTGDQHRFFKTIYLNAGNTVSIQNATGGTLNNSAAYHFLTIFRLSGPSQIAASETVEASYAGAASTTCPHAAYATVNFDQQITDSHGAVTTGASWKFTAPVAGRYSVKTNVMTGGTTGWAAGEGLTMRLRKNGSLFRYLHDEVVENTTSQNIFRKARGASNIRLLAGEYIDVQVYQSSGVSLVCGGDSNLTYIDIVREGNY